MRKLCRQLFGAMRQFRRSNRGNVALAFAIGTLPIVAGVGAAVDYSRANSTRSTMQGALDAAALGAIKSAGSLSKSELQAMAANYFGPSFNRKDASNTQFTADYDAGTDILTVRGSAQVKTALMGVMGVNQIYVSATSKATTSSKRWPVCVLVTASTEKHTLMTMQSAKLDFDGCMVQVNTQDWDAVESRQSGYIHSNNGENCFVGQIHYGDVLPPKNPACTFFADPFAKYTMPASAATCDYNAYSATGTGVVLKPGTYCGGLTLNGGKITLSPGLYIVKDGDFWVTGGSDVTAEGVTVLLTGATPNYKIDTNATLKITPANAAAAGKFAGFAFYLDNGSNVSCARINDGGKLSSGKKAGDCASTISNNAKVTLSGIVYMVGEAILVENNAVLTVNPGTLIADFIVGNNSAVISLTGSLNAATSAELAMQKNSQSDTNRTVRLVR